MQALICLMLAELAYAGIWHYFGTLYTIEFAHMVYTVSKLMAHSCHTAQHWTLHEIVRMLL